MSEENEKIHKATYYRDIIKELAADVCQKHPQPRCAHYEKALSDYLTKQQKLSPAHKIKSRDIHSNVHRALEKLEEKGEFFRIGLYHYPDLPQYRRQYYQAEIQKHIRFARPDIHEISHNTCVITIEDTPEKKAVELFEAYIGSDKCYGIIAHDNYLVIMLKPTESSQDETNINHISDMVNTLYSKQPRKVYRLVKSTQNADDIDNPLPEEETAD